MKILHLEDDPGDVQLVRELLHDEWSDCEIRAVASQSDYLEELKRGGHALILSDFTLVSFTGMDALKLAKEHAPHTPFVFLSGTIGEDRALDAIREGANDYVLKDRMKRLTTAIHRALRESRERKARIASESRIREQADLINKARDAIVVVDASNRITFWNQGAERLMGWTAAEAQGKTVEEIFGLFAAPKLNESSDVASAQAGWQDELRSFTKSGQPRTLETHSSLITDAQGKPKARFHIISDITEKKELQEQLLRVQRLESIGMLAAGIAHDINNVLTPILMAAPMLRRHTTDPLDLRLLQTLETSAERGAGLVRQILAFAHGTAGEPHPTPLKHLVRDILNVIEETFPRGIHLDLEIPANTWSVLANPTQIHQVLLNLCVNARDAMPHGGKLTLHATNIRLSETAVAKLEGARPGLFVLIEIADTGTGISPEVLKRIWEPFFTTKAQGKGTGLGLSTVRGIVQSHHGFIHLETEVGKGTTFRIYLPAVDVDAEDTSARTNPPFLSRGNGELILLIDDEATNREVTQAALARHGYRVLAAANGTEAVALFVPRCDEVKLVICDLNLPNQNGFSLARTLQRLQPDVRILIISGLASDPALRLSDSAPPIDGLLAKPFKQEALLRQVAALMVPKPAPN